MTKYDGLAKIILQNVGGKENIVSVTHCITRLRFKLHDEGKAQTETLKRTDGIVNVLKAGGLYQVVIGTEVPDVYRALVDVGHLGDLAAASASSTGKEKQSLFGSLISVITGTFGPIIWMLCAMGLIRGVLAILAQFSLIDRAGGTFVILDNAASSLFYFFPVLLGYTSAKRFGLNEITGMMLGLALCAPAIVGLAPSAVAIARGTAPEPLGTILGMRYYVRLFGIPVIFPAAGNYTSSVIPIILINWFASIIEKKIKDRIPVSVKSFMVPLIVFLAGLVAGLLVIGPVAAILTDIVSGAIQALFNHVPAIGGLIVGAFWQVLVIFGLHQGLSAIMYVNLASIRYDMVVGSSFPASFAQLAALTAVVIKSKDQHTKAVGIPAIVSAVVGITEPSIYGVTLPRRKPFIFSCVGAAVGGMILAVTRSYYYLVAGLGIFAFPRFIMTQEYSEMYNEPISLIHLYWALIAVVVAMAISFLLTIFFYHEPETGSLSGKSSGKSGASSGGTPGEKTEVAAPATGKVMALTDVEDEAFSSGSLGEGCAILPLVGEIRAPCDGTVSVLPDTCHALGISSDTGAEILVHVGMNTVELKGKGFSAKVKEGDKVKKGDLLLTFNIDEITKAGYSVVTPVIVSNADEFSSLDMAAEAGTDVKVGDALMSVTR